MVIDTPIDARKAIHIKASSQPSELTMNFLVTSLKLRTIADITTQAMLTP